MRWFLGGFPSSAAVLCFVAAAAFFATACDPSHGVTYENRMGFSAVVLINGRSEASLKPMEEKTFDLIKYDGESTFEAKDESGDVVFSERLTWEELRQRSWRIVIPPGQ